MTEILGIKEFTKELVKRHKDGKPLHPSVCSNVGRRYRFNDEAKLPQYQGSTCIIGLIISCAGVVQYVASVNKALDQGYEVDCGSASHFGSRIMVTIKRNHTNVPKTEEVQNDETLVSTGEPDVAEESTTDSTTAQDSESTETTEPESSVEESSEVPAEPEVEEPSENTEGESTETGTSGNEINWDYAESIINRDGISKKDAKDELAGYAKGFDVELSTNVKFENMIKDFKSKVGIDG